MVAVRHQHVGARLLMVSARLMVGERLSMRLTARVSVSARVSARFSARISARLSARHNARQDYSDSVTGLLLQREYYRVSVKLHEELGLVQDQYFLVKEGHQDVGE